MAPKLATKPRDKDKSNAQKMPRLPKNARIEKRPILRPPIPSPYTGADQKKVIYVSTKMPFISAVKRVRKLLGEIDKRSMGKVDLVEGKGSDKQKLRKLGERTNASTGKEPEEVVLKATNRAIQNVLGLALFFQGQDDCRVRLRTGTVGVVDDIVESAIPKGAETVEVEEEEEELPESRVRKASFVEVAITLM
ncbi:hypothetical protein HO173_008201 [Letharia columbiana]|uniref:Uncharacterized protein n=1 Tax=Letharia columbiana TaxID=112416 RepID=A0A8H6FS14_9LECA|nr:uncharacterized protein HO173_008201 [Letharia columbiana]KAF6233644.1 hypothetical protein HO173_008201 [Letharia columbiana]